MSASAISVRIDEIVLRGTAHIDRRAFQVALTEELSRLLGNGILLPVRIALPTVEAAAVQYEVRVGTAEVDADSLGRQLAASISGVLTAARSASVHA